MDFIVPNRQGHQQVVVYMSLTCSIKKWKLQFNAKICLEVILDKALTFKAHVNHIVTVALITLINVEIDFQGATVETALHIYATIILKEDLPYLVGW